MSNDLGSLDGFDGVNSFLSAVDSNSSGYRSFYDIDEAQNQVFSPPLLMDAAILADSYEDLLGKRTSKQIADIWLSSKHRYILLCLNIVHGKQTRIFLTC
ncbi:hypothetical protein BUALT_Bualt16G0004800 [Buddleja alternifolia]|uniref:Uncharacterized protein n=1 Tax=Buddleja alternifolia TaxID=168488 RepID=A0AAV6W856_9LAMI|nr:hypothetical protein BUALT_Bualt16G0004800 [Buddleja alternifolia]